MPAAVFSAADRLFFFDQKSGRSGFDGKKVLLA